MVKEIKKSAYQSYQEHKLYSWIIAIMLSMFLIALTLFNLFSYNFSIFFIPLLGIPFVFACIVSHCSLSAGNEIRGNDLLRGFSSYFHFPNFGNFNIISSFLKSILVELISSFLLAIILYSININNPTFKATVDEIINIVNQEGGISSNVLSDKLMANDYQLMKFVIGVVVPSSLLQFITFFHYISKGSMYVYAKKILMQKMIIPKNNYNRILGLHKKEIMRTYFALNYPLYILLVVGAATGAVIAGIITMQPLAAVTFGEIGAFAAMTFFLPFYFNNMEQFTLANQIYIESGIEELKRMFLEELKKIDPTASVNNLENENSENENNNGD